MLAGWLTGAVRTGLQVVWGYAAAWLIVHHIPVPSDVPPAVQVAVLAAIAGAAAGVIQWLERRSGDGLLARAARGVAKLLMLFLRPAAYPAVVKSPTSVEPVRNVP